MKRLVVLGVLAASGALTMTLAAFQQAPAPMVVEVEKLKDNLYVMKGGGGNSAVFIGTDGVTVVDTKNPGWGKPLLEKIQSVTTKPVVRIINTHTHGDHVSGNVDFPRHGRRRRAGKHQGQHGEHEAGHRTRGAAAPDRASSSRTAAAGCRSTRSRTR